MTIHDIIKRRGIKEILHFTTDRGITGILATDFLKARDRLSKEKYLEYIYKYNCADRQRDQAWWGFVNLSITSVNRQLFGISSGKWHADYDGWWCVLSFSPEICSHEGVYFTTTNNMYSGVIRKMGATGLENMFASHIVRWHGNVITRSSMIAENQPTCQQAEVLYPGQISLKYLKRVYVPNNEDAAKFDSIKHIFSLWAHIPCEVNMDHF